MFCPKCGDEFRPGFSVCPECAVSLVDELPPQESPEAQANQELVTVATFRTMFDASVARGALEADGLSSFVPGENMGSLGLRETGLHEAWVELKVKASDRDRAVELLKQAAHR